MDYFNDVLTQGRHALIISEGAQVGGWGDGGWHSSRLKFYLIFSFFRLFEIFPVIKL